MTDARDARAEQAFRDAFAQQADRLGPAPLSDVVRRRRRWPALAAAAAVLVLGGGLLAVQQHGPDSAPAVVSPGPAVPVSPGMTVTPAVAAPGQVVSVTYREDWVRGIYYQLARPAEPDTPVYLLDVSDTSASWSRVDGPPVFFDVGLGGVGPDRVQVPDDIDAGEWVLCTANARRQRCTSLTVPAEVVSPQLPTAVPDEPSPPVRVWIDPARRYLTVETTGSSSCPSLVAEVWPLGDDFLVVRTTALTRRPGQPCTADEQPHRDTWPLVGDQAQHASYAVVTTGADEGVRTQIMIGPPEAE